MTGWRIGYCVAKKELIAEMVKIYSYSVTSANSITQQAAIVAINGPQQCVANMLGEFKKRRDYVAKRLAEIDGLTCSIPRGAFYTFPDLARFKMRSTELARYLLMKKGLITVPGLEYGPSRYYYFQ